MGARGGKPTSVKKDTANLTDRWLAQLKNGRIIGATIVIGTAITYLSGVWSGLPDQIKSAVAGLWHRPTQLPGETGWIFIGYFREDIGAFIEGPKVEVVNSTLRARSRFVELGDTVRTKGAARVFMVDFATKGIEKKFVSPIKKGIISASDETGVTLAPGTELTVRDVSTGAWPGNLNHALWARIVLTSNSNSP